MKEEFAASETDKREGSIIKRNNFRLKIIGFIFLWFFSIVITYLLTVRARKQNETSLSLNTNNSLTQESKLSYFGDRTGVVGEYSKLAARLDGLQLGKVTFTMTNISGNRQEVEMNDLGIGNDIRKGDGLYTGVFIPEKEGDYYLTATVDIGSGDLLEFSDETNLLRVSTLKITPAMNNLQLYSGEDIELVFKVQNVSSNETSYIFYTSTNSGLLTVNGPVNRLTFDAFEEKEIKIIVGLSDTLPSTVYEPRIIGSVGLFGYPEDDVGLISNVWISVSHISR